MKRCLLLLLIILLLAGCSAEKPEQTQPTTDTQPTETAVKETAPSLLDPDASVTDRTKGAVAAFKVEGEGSSLAFMGDQLLIFYNDQSGPTRLVRLDRENYSVESTAELAGMVYPEMLGFRATAEALAYYSDQENAVIVLDQMLREVDRAAVPANLTGLPLICADMRTVFYTAGNELRALDLETGISRLLRQRDCKQMNLQQSHFDDSVLVCGVTLENDEYITEFISAATGETLGSDPHFITMSSWQDTYFLQRMEGTVWELLFAQDGEPLQAIAPREEHKDLRNALAMNGLVSVSNTGKGTELGFYDLESGKNTASITLTGLADVRNLTADPSGKYLWFFACDTEYNVTLYRWEPAASPTEDSQDHTKLRYTEENPDLEALAECRARADKLEETYGIAIHLLEQIPETEDYAFTHEFHPQAYSAALEQLEQALAQFPEDFFAALGKVSGDGKVHMGLVRDLQGRTANSVPDATGVQYWDGENAVFTLKITDDMIPAFYHELAHVLDTFIWNEALAFDDWDDLNPGGFHYDGNYTDYLIREDNTWLEGEGRAFIDSYSMTYPKEDRARIFEYAMQEGNEELFTSETLQKKLIQVCKGIRDAFGLKKDERTFPWEQYLEKSLAYKKK